MHTYMKHGLIVSRATGTVAKPPLVALPALNGYIRLLPAKLSKNAPHLWFATIEQAPALTAMLI